MTKSRPLFIVIGQKRIKLSNIKNYEVHEYTYEEEVTTRKLLPWEEEDEKTRKLIRDSFWVKLLIGNGDVEDAPAPKKINVKYLEIITYQNDQSKFYSSEIDIDAIVTKLDSYLAA